jgi:hypothetical protein
MSLALLSQFHHVERLAIRRRLVMLARSVRFPQRIWGQETARGLRKGRPRSSEIKSPVDQISQGLLRRLQTVSSPRLGRTAHSTVLKSRHVEPTTERGITVIALWHITDRYRQLVENLRLNGIVRPVTQKYVRLA